MNILWQFYLFGRIKGWSHLAYLAFSKCWAWVSSVDTWIHYAWMILILHPEPITLTNLLQHCWSQYLWIPTERRSDNDSNRCWVFHDVGSMTSWSSYSEIYKPMRGVSCAFSIRLQQPTLSPCRRKHSSICSESFISTVFADSVILASVFWMHWTNDFWHFATNYIVNACNYAL